MGFVAADSWASTPGVCVLGTVCVGWGLGEGYRCNSHCCIGFQPDCFGHLYRVVLHSMYACLCGVQLIMFGARAQCLLAC
jgi:hypothetical protein